MPMNFKQRAEEIINYQTGTKNESMFAIDCFNCNELLAIESSLLRADKEGYERGLEDAAKVAEEHDGDLNVYQEIRQLKELSNGK